MEFCDRCLSALRRHWVLLMVPAIVTIDFVSRRWWRLQGTLDGQLMLGIVQNLRAGRGFTSPSDQYWLTQSPATTWTKLPRVPVPDIGPIYTLLVSLWPGSAEAGMWAINLAALIAALLLVGLLGRGRADRVWLGVVAQLLIVFGPVQQTIFRFHSISSIAAAQGYDILATALVLAALFASCRRHPVAGATLLVFAALTRPALAVIPLAIFLGYGITSSGRADKLFRACAVASASLALWFLMIWPLIAGSTPKQLHWHPANPAPLANAVLGWFGLEFVYETSAAAGVLLCLCLFAWMLWVAVPSKSPMTERLLATTALAVVAIVVFGRTLLVQDMFVNDERHLLLARITVLTISVRTLHFWVWPKVPSRWQHIRPYKGVVAALVAVWLIGASVLNGNLRLLPVYSLPPLEPGLVALVQEAVDNGAVVLSSDSSMLYNRTRISSIDVLRTHEPSTGKVRNGRQEARELARFSKNAVVVTFDQTILDGPPLPIECAVVVSSVRAPPIVVEIYDIGECGSE